jgi:hypothetical protein
MPSPVSLTILPDPTRLHLLHLSAEATAITATVRTTAATACCPACGHSSTRVHSRYTRPFALHASIRATRAALPTCPGTVSP